MQRPTKKVVSENFKDAAGEAFYQVSIINQL
jgi:hypothetical protein